MRIISGTLRGRNFASPRSPRTHPMGDRVRGALFNTLGDIKGLTVLDAFAGTGALGFEALSRGASKALLIENDKSAQMTIVDNIGSLDLHSRAYLIKSSCLTWSNNSPGELFDLVLLDPPYNAIKTQTLQKIAAHTAKTGVLVLSWPGREEILDISTRGESELQFSVVEAKSYGDAQLVFYRRS